MRSNRDICNDNYHRDLMQGLRKYSCEGRIKPAWRGSEKASEWSQYPLPEPWLFHLLTGQGWLRVLAFCNSPILFLHWFVTKDSSPYVRSSGFPEPDPEPTLHGCLPRSLLECGKWPSWVQSLMLVWQGEDCSATGSDSFLLLAPPTFQCLLF